MALGPGRYDDLCTYVREKSGGMGVMIIVFPKRDDPQQGPGFSLQAPPEFLPFMVKTLRQIITELERDTAQDQREFYRRN